MKQKLCFLAMLCLFLTAAAQENIADKGIKPGQPVPDVTITGASGLRVAGKTLSTFRFSRLRGKLVILDFWATWCAPCRNMVPVMDSLQRRFGEKVLFLPIAYQRADIVAPVLADIRRLHAFDLPGVTGDQVLNNLFPHRSLPHYVWIDRNGIVRAITEEKEVTAANIQKMLDGQEPLLPQKQDLMMPYDPGRPLLIAGNGGNGAALAYHSLLSAYVPGLRGGMDISPADSIKGQRFNVRNAPFTWLCRLAYSDHNRWFTSAMIRIRSADSARMTTPLSGQAFADWLQQGNGWCYELLVPPALTANAYDLIRQDLSRLFPRYRVAVENTRTRCIVLVRTSGIDKIRSSGGPASADVGPYTCELRNTGLGQLVKRLQVQYMQNAPLPVVDRTGYTGTVDLSLHAPLYDVAALNKELEKYDLRFTEQDADTELLVIRDNDNDRQSAIKP